MPADSRILLALFMAIATAFFAGTAAAAPPNVFTQRPNIDPKLLLGLEQAKPEVRDRIGPTH